MRVKGLQVMVEFLKSTDADENIVSTFVTYDAYSGQHISAFGVADDVGGVFGCYDWHGDFTFVSGTSRGERILKYAHARGL